MIDPKNVKLTVASSPHVCSPVNTTRLMLDVLIALIPALAMAVYVFGPRALTLTAVSVAGCEFFEWAYRKLLKKPCANGDLSAAVTGVLLAFVCPVTLPYWTILIGDFFAIIVVKQLFGGLGMNFMNPALGGRAFLMMSYPIAMTTWVLPGTENWANVVSAADAVTGATPMASLHSHLDVASGLNVHTLPETANGLLDLFVGNIGGCVGEISALMLLIGGIYLVWRGVIRLRIPVAFIGTVAVICFLFPQGGIGRVDWMLYNLCGGGQMLGASFMATDYVTSPVTKTGEILFGVGCGLLTIFIRYFGGYPEGVSYAILIMNICVWLLDKAGKPARYGVTKEMREKAKAEKKAAKEGKAA